MDRTTIGTVARSTRDSVAAYRDANDLPNYDATLRHLLEEAGADDVLETEA
jgi:hypothetical protein